MDDFSVTQIVVPMVTGIIGWLFNKTVITPLGALIEKASKACDVVIDQADKVDEIHEEVLRKRTKPAKKRRCSSFQGQGASELDD